MTPFLTPQSEYSSILTIRQENSSGWTDSLRTDHSLILFSFQRVLFPCCPADRQMKESWREGKRRSQTRVKNSAVGVCAARSSTTRGRSARWSQASSRGGRGWDQQVTQSCLFMRRKTGEHHARQINHELEDCMCHVEEAHVQSKLHQTHYSVYTSSRLPI